MTLTYITPFNCDNKDSYLYNRAKSFLSKSYLSDFTKRIFVDFSSCPTISDELEEIAVSRGIKYIRLERFGELFSIGVCRNTGVMEADSDYISFQDVDLYANDSTYKKIEERVGSYKYFNEFEMIPCIYLTENFSINYFNMQESDQSNEINRAYYEYDDSVIQMYAPASSCQILNRKFYLLSGGIQKEFYGHGFEDFELHYRLSDMSKKFYRTHDSRSHNFTYNSIDYKGYRPLFSMFGRPLMNDGIYFVHLWHDNHAGTNYQKRNRTNRNIFERLIADYDNGTSRIAPLPNIYNKEKILVLSSKRSLNTMSTRHIFVEIGSCDFIDEKIIGNGYSLHELVKLKKYDRVFFFNPYGNKHRLSLYRFCRESNIPFYVYDRGGLNDSWFIDPNGFNGDSATYSRERWDHELSLDESTDIGNYIKSTFLSDETLEKNGNRIGSDFFREKYGDGNKKILFVPYQRPNDSVINYFSGNVENIEDFSLKLRSIASKLSNDWVVVAKKHPLESKIDLPDNVIELPSDTHIYDCIQGCDSVLLINSGVGLLSAMSKKPVFHFGETYYSHTGIACEVIDVDDAVEKIVSGYQVNFDTVKRFVHYLVNNVYSFAKTEYREFKHENGSLTNAAFISRFYNIKIIDNIKIERLWRENPYPVKSRYYDYYRSYFEPKKPSVAPVKPITNATTISNEVKSSVVNISTAKPKKYGVKHKLKKILKNPVGVVKRKLNNL